MAIQRFAVKVPLDPTFTYDSTYTSITDTSKYWVLMDVFYNDTWNPSINPRPLVYIMPGAGVYERYATNSVAITSHTDRGQLVAVIYYHHSASTDPDYTPQPPWYDDWGFFRRNYNQFLNRRVQNFQSCLKYTVDTLVDDRSLFNIDITNLFAIGKSQGGATLLTWSMMSQTNTFNYSLYGSKVKAIINNQGLVGTTTEGWYNPDRTIRALGRGISLSRHLMIHVYNDQDPSGDYDIAARLRHAVVSNRRSQHAFINFTDLGHEQDFTFNATLVASIVAGDSPMQATWSGGTMQVLTEQELQNQTYTLYPVT
ncbi:hypothetical protein QJS83_14740 [Bdellovibrio sp. 22V]|uniref:hypothetical protein n=1 Tax=Bdellovibrio sp. 22V TaxID=3044166 RepID=UPI002542EDF5|nr:hypothetical protein [Bdellovibrio sp. 22V]WII71720.1 hypothetical protein QJS83_14740 [Bdellovibrio sp. 22V]